MSKSSQRKPNKPHHQERSNFHQSRVNHILEHREPLKSNQPIRSRSLLCEGMTGATEAVITLLKGDGVEVIYADPSLCPVQIRLGTPESPNFEEDRRITIKDVSLLGSITTSPYNVTVSVPTQSITALESLTPIDVFSGRQYLTFAKKESVITTIGGSLTYRYLIHPKLGPAWVLESYVIGNPRPRATSDQLITKEIAKNPIMVQLK